MRRIARAAVIAALVTAGTSLVAPSRADAACSADPTVDGSGAAGPLGPIGFMGDSTGIGMIENGSLVAQLVTAGWGPVRASAICGGQATTNRSSAVLTIADWRQSGFDPPVLLLGFGSNDVGFCRDDKAACRARIDGAMRAIGPDRQVSWQNITHGEVAWQNAWNQALTDAATTYPLLDIADWRAAVTADPTLVGFDQVHGANAAANVKRSALLVTAAQRWSEARLDTAVPPVPAAIAAGGPAGFQPLPNPTRLIDTRDNRGGTRLVAGAKTTIDLSALAPSGTVPPGATAVAVNLTIDRAAGPGYVTAWGCNDPPPSVSALNYPANAPRAAHVIVPLNAGHICVLSKAAADVIVDLDGVYVPGAGLRYTPSAPLRLLDTRNNGPLLAAGTVTTITIPAVNGVAPQAVAVNLTGIGATTAGFVSAYPCGTSAPEVSALNVDSAAPRANLVQVRVGTGGTLCILNQSPVHLVVDLAGIYGAAGLLLQATAPTRILDTRDGTGGWLGATAAGQSIALAAQPPTAQGAVMTITSAAGAGAGYVTLYPCTVTPPTASNLNHGRAETVANAASVLGAGCLTTQLRGHLVVDLTGWWVP